MAEQIGRFLINSDIVSTVSRTIALPTPINSAVQFLSTTTGEGSHALFIVVKDANAGLFYQFSFSVGFNFTGNSWLEVMPLESTIGSDNGIALDFKSDGLTGYLRLRRKYGSAPITANILVYNLGYDAEVTPISNPESNADTAGSIVSTPQGPVVGGSGDGVTDHNALTNKGTFPHSAIDSHLQADSPHNGHEKISNKNRPGGYAGLDSNNKVPTALLNIGTEGDAVLSASDTDIERKQNKNTPDGYLGLDADAKASASNLPIGTTEDSVMRGDGPGVEKISNKDSANGYAGLDSNRKILPEVIPTGTSEGTVLAGNDPSVERVANKNSANGYMGLGSNSKADINNLPVGNTDTTVMRGDGPGVEKIANKNAPDGYMGLDSNSKAILSTLPIGTDEFSVLRGDAPGCEKLTNKNRAGGYVGLGSDTLIESRFLRFGTTSDSVCRGDDPRLSVSSGAYIEGIDVTDQKNNASISLSSYTESYIEGSLKVYLNGQRLIRDVHYVEDPQIVAFSFIDMEFEDADIVYVDLRAIATSGVFEGVDISSQVEDGVLSYTVVGAANYAPGSLKVYINGIKQIKGRQYDESPDTGEFEFYDESGPVVGDYVIVDFIKQSS